MSVRQYHRRFASRESSSGRRPRGRPLALLTAVATVAGLGTAGLAQADGVPVQLGGSPMNTFVGPLGQLQAFMAGNPRGVFFAPSATLGDAGFFLAFPEGSSVPDDVEGEVYGFDGSAGPGGLESYEQRGQAPVAGSGTADDPLRQVTRYAATGYDATAAEITQTTSYVNGQGRFLVQWDVKNVSGSPLNFKAFTAADFYFDGDDYGTGIFTQGPPRFIGGTNTETGRSGGFEETGNADSPAWSHYQSLVWDLNDPDDDPSDRVWNTIEHAADADSPGLQDTVINGRVDNAAAVEWSTFGSDRKLAPGATASFSLVARAAIPATLQLTPVNPTSAQGVAIPFVASISDTDGAPVFAGRILRYAIAGANPTTGQVQVGADGKATVIDPGGNVGQDAVTVWIDLDNDGVRGEAEPTASVLGTFVDVTPPVCSVAPLAGKIGGRGKKAKPLSVDVTCDSPATLTGSARLKIVVGKRKVRVKRGRRHVLKTRVVTRTVALPPVKGVTAPGQRTRIQIAVPRKFAKRYARRKATATVTVTAADQVGNAAQAAGARATSLLRYRK